MACRNCFDNCDDPISDQCVKYTGPDIELLGICTGDTLSKVEEQLISKIANLLDGTGISLADVTFINAPWLASLFLGQDKTVSNLIQLLINSSQTLKQLIDSLAATSVSFNTGCLDGLPSNPSRDQIMQVLLYNFCQIKETVDSLPGTYVTEADLTSLVTNIIKTTQGTTVKYKDRMVPYVVYPYVGPISNFDSTGKGFTSTGFERVFLCNGNNGTIDYRGRTMVGAVRNVPGGTLDAAVSPSSPENSLSNVNYGLNEKFGKNFHKLATPELP